MKPRIEQSPERKLAGKKLIMSFSEYKVAELWNDFMRRRKEFKNNITGDLISMTVYQPGFFTSFDPAKEFEKWAAMEVSDFENVPPDIDTFLLKGGLYAVFEYKGSSNDNSIYDYIFRTWMPESNYLLDERPHFEVLGSKYKNNDIDSEEEIWIPVRPKQKEILL